MKEDKHDAVTEAVEKALAAAEAATDGAMEAQAAALAAKKATQMPVAAAPTDQGDKRALVVAVASAVCAALALGAAGLVYLRSVADLREAAELQAAAVGAIIEKAKTLDASVAGLAPETLARRAEVEKLLQDVKAVLAEQPKPGVTADDLEKLRSDIVASIAEVALKSSGTAAAPATSSGPECSELTMMLGQAMRQLDAVQKQMAQPQAKSDRPASAPAKPAGKKPARPAKPQGQVQGQTIYSFP